MRHVQKKGKPKGKIQLEYIDIRSVLDEIGIDYRESGKNVGTGWIGVCCPFCGNDHGYHLGICLKSPVISCLKCGKIGNILTYFIEELGSFQKAITILGDSVPRELRSFEAEERERAITVELPENAKKEISVYHESYLEGRGYDHKELTEKFNLHFVGPTGGEWRNRIIVPVIKRYKLITFTSVSISDDSNLRYKHLSEEKSVIPIKDYLLGLEFTDGNSCILVEGLFDMMRIGDGAVCGFGVKITSEQKRLLSKFQTVVIAFDGDSAGRTSSENLANDLAPFCDCKIVDLPDGKDPDNLSKGDIKYIRRLIGK
ncbi:MAG: toprim domain-containing protein [Candidatus Tenebribacter davisii]|nr:toprim domain-containing protein [Candidatus Tenebribacter davisii]